MAIVTTTHPDRAIEAIARRQHGAFSRDQASGVGVSGRMIDARVASGAWIRLARGVYALAAHPFSWKRQVKAAELSVTGSAVSHRSAAVLHGLSGLRPGRIDLTVSTTGSARSPLAAVHRRCSFTTTSVEGITTTSRPRVIVDLAAQLTPNAFEAVFDDAVVRRLVTVDDIRNECDALAGSRVRGIGMVRRTLRERVDGAMPAASELERSLNRVLAHPRLPPSVTQSAFPWWPDEPYRVDAFIPAWRRIVEADGRRWHTREADFERDRWRDHLAQRHGYEVTRFTYRQLVVSPTYVLDVLLDIGRRAA
jgi:very-short-patch-repair endonuclease